ncbi:hypothetical protein APHAL10511_005558 [Amanita phalloides]|nr:hypothetical protein APHAL10511_005558 [Amanita phalloides]
MPYYGPLGDEYVPREKAFLAGDFICGVGYGVQLVLYTKCARYLWSRRKIRRKISLFLLGYTTVLLSLSSMFVSSSAWITEDIYTNGREYRGGPWAYSLATQYLPGNVLFLVAGFLLTCLSDLLVLWRCWVVWNSSGKLTAFVVTAIPATGLLASFAIGILWAWRTSHDPAFEMAIATVYCATSLCSNILLTSLIVLRLVLQRQRILLALSPEHAAHYVSLTAIIIESAASYSVFATVYIITYSFHIPINWVFLPLALTSQQIAGYLIILRVARGRAWSLDAPRIASSEPRLTALDFNAPVLSSHIDMDQEPIEVEQGNPLSTSTLLTGSVSS